VNRIENILNAIHPYAPNATIGVDSDGYLIVRLKMFLDPVTGRAELNFHDEEDFDE
jgi:hypothetical protein